MAEGKNKIIVYKDWIKKFEALKDAEAGKLIKHFFRYVNDLNPVAPDRVTELSFIDIEQTLKRDLKKWESFIDKQSENGKKGGRPKNPEEPIESQKTQALIEEPKKADMVIGNGIAIVSDISKYNTHKDIFDSEDFFTKNQIQFEKICMAASKNSEEGLLGLRKFHLHLVENERYPQTKKQILAGFEKWMLKEKKQYNGTHQQKPGTSEARIAALKKW